MLLHYRDVIPGCQEVFYVFVLLYRLPSLRRRRRRVRRQRVPGLHAATRGAEVRREHRRILAGELRHDLVLAVAVEVRQPHVVAAAAALEARDPRARLADEPALAVAIEDPGLAVAGERHQVGLAVAVEIAVSDRRHLGAPLLDRQRQAGPGGGGL